MKHTSSFLTALLLRGNATLVNTGRTHSHFKDRNSTNLLKTKCRRESNRNVNRYFVDNFRLELRRNEELTL